MKSRKCFNFSGEERFFQGHFPGMPVLPGVMQLEFAHRFAEELSGHPLELKEVRKMKFVHIIEPGQEVVLELEGEGDVVYRFMKGETLCSSGVLVY